MWVRLGANDESQAGTAGAVGGERPAAYLRSCRADKGTQLPVLGTPEIVPRAACSRASYMRPRCVDEFAAAV